jgi:predicted dienelactone hydrolase
MNTRLCKRIVFVGLIVTLALAIAPFAGAQDGPKPEAVGLRPDAPPYALHGPYWVGARDFVIEPDSERPLTITVWYPALNPEGLPEETVYEMAAASSIRFAFPDQTDWGIRGRAIMDAQPDAADAPYPLVIYSHGAGAWRQMSTYFVEHLASYGFVVIAPEHPGEAPVADMFWQAFIHRPDDVRRTIDYAASLTEPGGALENTIHLDQVGVTGASGGGYTALAAAGAQIDWTGLMSWCTNHPEADTWAFCPVLAEHGAEMAALSGLAGVPADLWPAMNDPRIDAVVSLAGVAFIFGPKGMQSLSVPLLTVGGSGDAVLPAEWNIYVTNEHASSVKKALIVLKGSDHYIFADGCDRTPWLNEMGLSFLCTDSIWDVDRAHDLINHFTTAFLLATLKGNPDAAAALAPDAVSFPGITYQATGF